MIEAAEWFKGAAEQGEAEAQYNLGICYANGYGVIQNKVIAYAWFSVVRENMLNEANECMDILEKELSPDEIDQGLSIAECYLKGDSF